MLDIHYWGSIASIIGIPSALIAVPAAWISWSNANKSTAIANRLAEKTIIEGISILNQRLEKAQQITAKYHSGMYEGSNVKDDIEVIQEFSIVLSDHIRYFDKDDSENPAEKLRISLNTIFENFRKTPSLEARYENLAKIHIELNTFKTVARGAIDSLIISEL